MQGIGSKGILREMHCKKFQHQGFRAGKVEDLEKTSYKFQCLKLLLKNR